MIKNTVDRENNYLALERAVLVVQELLEFFPWQSLEFASFPEIEIVSAVAIDDANGFYSADTNKIYIAEEYLLANADNISAILNLILEKYCHYIDAQINSADGNSIVNNP